MSACHFFCCCWVTYCGWRCTLIFSSFTNISLAKYLQISTPTLCYGIMSLLLAIYSTVYTVTTCILLSKTLRTAWSGAMSATMSTLAKCMIMCVAEETNRNRCWYYMHSDWSSTAAYFVHALSLCFREGPWSTVWNELCQHWWSSSWLNYVVRRWLIECHSFYLKQHKDSVLFSLKILLLYKQRKRET